VVDSILNITEREGSIRAQLVIERQVRRREIDTAIDFLSLALGHVSEMVGLAPHPFVSGGTTQQGGGGGQTVS